MEPDSSRASGVGEERRISIAPGPIFSAGDGHRHCLRINGGYPWSDFIEGAIQTLGKLATTKASRG